MKAWAFADRVQRMKDCPLSLVGDRKMMQFSRQIWTICCPEFLRLLLVLKIPERSRLAAFTASLRGDCSRSVYHVQVEALDISATTVVRREDGYFTLSISVCFIQDF